MIHPYVTLGSTERPSQILITLTDNSCNRVIVESAQQIERIDVASIQHGVVMTYSRLALLQPGHIVLVWSKGMSYFVALGWHPIPSSRVSQQVLASDVEDIAKDW
jgi:hypothetical protein